MKIEDLMLGDWVYWWPGKNDRPLATRVNEINGRTGAIGVAGAGDGEALAVDVKPMPITMDILDRSGFRPTESRDYREIDEYCCMSAVERPYGWAAFAVDGYNRKHLITTMRYVHELQHLLTALKIGREVTP